MSPTHTPIPTQQDSQAIQPAEEILLWKEPDPASTELFQLTVELEKAQTGDQLESFALVDFTFYGFEALFEHTPVEGSATMINGGLCTFDVNAQEVIAAIERAKANGLELRRRDVQRVTDDEVRQYVRDPRGKWQEEFRVTVIIGYAVS